MFEGDCEIKKNIDDEIGIVYLIRAKDSSGNKLWAYISIRPTKLEEFLASQAKGARDLTEYGEIMKSGFGDMPSEEIQKEMEETHGINHELEGEIRSVAERLGNDIKGP